MLRRAAFYEEPVVAEINGLVVLCEGGFATVLASGRCRRDLSGQPHFSWKESIQCRARAHDQRVHAIKLKTEAKFGLSEHSTVDLAELCAKRPDGGSGVIAPVTSLDGKWFFSNAGAYYKISLTIIAI